MEITGQRHEAAAILAEAQNPGLAIDAANASPIGEVIAETPTLGLLGKLAEFVKDRVDGADGLASARYAKTRERQRELHATAASLGFRAY